MDILKFIEDIQTIDLHIITICTKGACYQFAKFLQIYFPTSELYITADGGHVVLKYDECFYDVNGINDELCVKLTSEEEINCSKWSFWKNNYVGTECQNCGEIIKLTTEKR